MKYASPHRNRLCGLATTALAALLLPAAAQAAATFGSLANFDSVNDSGKTAHGFEIDLEGLDKSRITDVFGLNRNFGTASPGDVERYGLPTVGDLLDGSGKVIGAKVVYLASFANGAWSAGTLSNGAYVTPGESCWKFGNVGYPNVPCDHFGVSTIGSATRTSYTWLVESGTAGQLDKATVAIPSVSFTPPPPVAPGVAPAPVEAVIQAPLVVPAPDPVIARQQSAYWVKIVQTSLPENVDLNDLMGGHNPFENPGVAALHDKPETEIEWQPLQLGPNPLFKEVQNAVSGAIGDKSVVLRYEFYRYLGQFDDEGYVDPTAAQTPHGNVLNASVGSYIGEQIAGFNAVQAVPEPQTWALLLAGIAMVGFLARSRS